MGPSAYARSAGIISGRTIRQQGLATICKDRGREGNHRPAEMDGLAHEPVGAKKEE